jgi:DNA-binding SARP family transcriptional activator
MSQPYVAMPIHDQQGPLQPQLVICVLGGLRVLFTGKPVSLSAKEIALVAALAVRGSRGASRDTLLAALWPEQDPRLAGRSLHTIRWKLHRRLECVLDSTPLIVHAHHTYTLNACAVAVDALLFEQLADEGDELARAGDWPDAIELYGRAAAPYEGDLYDGVEISAELVIERERLRVRFQNLLTRLAHEAYERHDFVDSLRFLQRFLARSSRTTANSDNRGTASALRIRRPQL